MFYTHALKATEEKNFSKVSWITHQDKLGFNRSTSVGCSNVTSRIGQPKGPDLEDRPFFSFNAENTDVYFEKALRKKRFRSDFQSE